jgi:NitT/TauT family transport system substrate-binding protein
MKKIALLLSLFSLFILSACGYEKQALTKSNKGLEKVTLQIDGAATPYYSPLYYAKEKGYFADEGLDVDFYYATASEIVKNVATNNITFGFPNADPVVIGRSNGVPVNIIHTTYQEGLGSVIFKKSSGIRQPADLKGRIIGITSYGSPNFIQLQIILEKAGLSLQDVKIKIIGTGAIVNALVSDQVDAVCFSMLRTYDLKAQGEDVGEFRSEDYMPTQGNVLITSEAFRKSHPEVCKKFIRALNRSINSLTNGGQLKNAIALSIQKYAPGAKGSEQKIEMIMQKEFAAKLWRSRNTEIHGLGYSDLKRYNQYIHLLKKYKLIDKTYSARDLAINLVEKK